jgi:PAS domain S-box-containing protein
LAILLAALADGVTILDRAGRVQFFRPSVDRILGREPGELEGRHWADVVHPEDIPAAETGFESAVAQPGVPVRGSLRMWHKDGGARHLDVTAVALFHERAVGGLVIYARDATPRLHLEDRLRRAQRLQAVGELAAGLAHDFNNLIHVASGYAGAAREQLPPEAGAGRELALAQAALRRAGTLSRQLLALGQRTLGQHAVQDLNFQASQLLGLLERSLGKPIRVTFQPGARVPAVLADAAQLDQVLLNLCLNARDAMPDGGTLTVATSAVPAPPEATVRGAPGDAPWACIAVSDTGRGIAPDVLPRIFEPFFTTKAPGQGTGLGLSNARGIVEQHGGVLRVESAPGRGTIFRVILPPATASLPAPTAVHGPAGATVLVADDDGDARALLVRMLERRGYRVLSAANSDEAVHAFVDSTQPIVLAILDVMMADASGLTAARRLRVLDPALPILICTGYSREALQKDQAALEGLEVISKPYDPLALLQRVHALASPRTGLPRR